MCPTVHELWLRWTFCANLVLRLSHVWINIKLETMRQMALNLKIISKLIKHRTFLQIKKYFSLSFYCDLLFCNIYLKSYWKKFLYSLAYLRVLIFNKRVENLSPIQNGIQKKFAYWNKNRLINSAPATTLFIPLFLPSCFLRVPSPLISHCRRPFG